MSTIARGTKAAGGTDFVDGTDILASEVNTDLNVIVNEINGGLNQDNLSPATQVPNSMLVTIEPSIVNDYSANAAESGTVTTPGDSATSAANLATNLEGELERLRYRIEANNGYRAGSIFVNSSGTEIGTSWTEPPIQGPNMLVNPGFEQHSITSGEAPDGWNLSGTPATTGIESAALPITGTHKRSFVFTSDASNEGISQTVEGIRSSSKYLVGFKYFRTAGTVLLSTSGALASGNNYQDVASTDSSSSGVQVWQAIVQADGSGSDISLTIQETTGSGDVNVVAAWFYEINDDFPSPQPPIPSQSATHNTAETLPATFTGLQWNWEEIGELALSQYIPGPGYRLVFEAQISWTTATVNNNAEMEHGIRLNVDSGGGASVVDGPYVSVSGGLGSVQLKWGQIGRLRHEIENLTPGLTYAFTVEVGAYNDNSGDSQMAVSPLVNGVQSISKSWLRVERI